VKKNGKWTWTPVREAVGMNHETFLRLVLSAVKQEEEE
jgi:hypothetical protein